MRSHRVEFQNDDGQILAGKLDMPVTGDPQAFVLFAHCFTCSKNLKAVVNISNALTERGLGVLRFDFTGLGESQGNFADTNFSTNIEDLIAAARFLEEDYQAPEVLLGHSLGGAGVLAAAERIPSAVAVATVGAPCEPSHVTHLFADARDDIESEGEQDVVLAGRKFTIKKQFLDDLEQTTMANRIANLNRALLVMHSPIDETVGVDNARLIYESAKHPKSFVSLDDANHLLTRERDSRYVGAMVASWAMRYLPKVEAQRVDDGWVLAESGEAGFYTQIHAGKHALVADEPESYGGTDLGPSPYDLLSASLGACTAMTLRMYADRKKWPVHGISVRLFHEKIHAADCDDCENKSGKIDRIRREIRLEGPLDQEQRARLLEIADRCPVHRTLHSEVRIESMLIDS